MSKISRKYIEFLNHYKYIVLFIWFIITIIASIFAMDFIKNTTQQFGRPKGSGAQDAYDALKKYFPSQADTSNVALYVERNDRSSIFGDDFRKFTLKLNNTIMSRSNNKITSFNSFYTLRELDIPFELAAKGFIASNNQSSIIALTIGLSYVDVEAGEEAVYVANEAQNILKEINTNNGDNSLKVISTGVPAWLDLMISSAEKDMETMDAIVLPIAFLILAYVVKSLRLLTITLITVGVSISTTFGVMTFVTINVIPIISSTPSIMMSILIAMSIDYQLFLLSRYYQEIISEYPTSNEEIVEIVIKTAGETIVVSGLTLSFCFLGLLLIPLAMIQSIGIACSIAIFITLIVNLTITPAMLLSFPQFYEKAKLPFKCCNSSIKQQESGEHSRISTVESSSININYGSYYNSDINVTLNNEQQVENKSGFWYKLGYFVTKPLNAIIIICLCVGFIIPFAMHAFEMKTTDNMSDALPRGHEISAAYQQMTVEFGYGTVAPYPLLIVPPKNMKIMSDEFFQDSQSILRELASKIPRTNIQNFQGVMYQNGIPLDVSTYNCSINSPIPILRGYCEALKMSERMFVSPIQKNGQQSTIVMIELDFDPLGSYGLDWLHKARNAISNVLQQKEYSQKYQLFLGGVNADTMDNINVVYKELPKMIAITLGVVLLFIGITFRSITIPIRSVLTIVMTLLFVYGFASLVYQHNILDFLNMAAFSGESSVYWLVPCTVFSISVGIALDYDVFLLTRIREVRLQGLNDTGAIVEGLAQTGGIITAAGVIMSIAFSGLLISHMKILNEMAFYLMFSVLFDTFIVRSLVAPASMALVGKCGLNWWPTKMVDPINNNNNDKYQQINSIL